MQWDIFCRVIDNFGDVGVCWRLSAELARRGEQVRLWLDDPQALAWMAPGALEGHVPGVEVIPWRSPLPDVDPGRPADVWIEAFGCEPPPECIEALAARIANGARAPVWINLEYLSAESYVERSHRLPSPVSSGPLRGFVTKWFFYPGFTPRTGGLLRETDLLARQSAFDAEAWLHNLGLPGRRNARRVSLFCYEPAALPDVLQQAGHDATPSDWLVTPGRAWQAVQAAASPGPACPTCRLLALPLLPQVEFDHLLWSADLNFVRGEDSLARALWAGKPFVWHIYPQHDGAHHAKLEAFLDWLEAPDSLRDFHRAWNGIGSVRARWPDAGTLSAWRDAALSARERLLAQADLCQQLVGFVLEKR
ncbi:elongation factor P maturation arginine rhamnosyltransferase EarP [Hydrogenophaga sp. BPS33]|uniref:elongation factor P maturation arginine rhamnosyltransferase EarP n=1 Tax=Hydrogenophaga sp. BPS33 TaxID=2651974 RepID=UPI0013200BA6|nr:elongation factor P maturation arginine rhamnosyltransferase EarP [Hydrogenophaga sp. BPS33]QHE85642.1 elongation factor P maturation arginine rhamnosyltransferase EarP [Hydrogenophaga sp. BPS33]